MHVARQADRLAWLCAQTLSGCTPRLERWACNGEDANQQVDTTVVLLLRGILFDIIFDDGVLAFLFEAL